MKKILLTTLLASRLISNAYAQDCPNGNFENWAIYPYSVPDSGWYNSNPSSLALRDSLTVWPVTGVSGNAVHIQTAIVGTDTLQAYVINTSGDPKNGSGGVPYSQQPTAITGYYRYNLLGNDSAIILVMFKKAGSVVSSQWITFRGTGSLLTFTHFSFPLTLTVVPDTVIVAAASSNVQGTGLQSGSWLELDELSFTGTGITQPIAGGSFDTWTSTTLDKPAGWQINSGGNSGVGVVRSTAHFAGSYSIQLTTQPGGGGGSAVNNSQITTGHNTPNYGPAGGLPYTRTIDTLTGYYMYTPAGVDTGNLYVNLMASGSNVGGAGYHFFAASTWTPFELPFGAFSTPDTMRIDILSGSWAATIPGSILHIDFLQLKSQPLPPAYMPELNTITYNCLVYPNPATNVLNFGFQTGLPGSADLVIYDLTGRIIDQRHFDTVPSVITIPVGQLPSGMYFYGINNNGDALRGKFIKQ